MDPTSFAAALPHGALRQIFPDIFFVTGMNKLHHNGADIQTSRNMTIVRSESTLTLINTVRLNEEGLKALDALGGVSHIVRIGAFHDRDDSFYKHRYPDATLWTFKGVQYASGLIADRLLEENGPVPFLGCSVFEFKTSKHPEGILHIQREGGILVSCDSIQNITGVDEFYNAQTAQTFKEHGLIQPANISPIWLGATRTQEEDFCRLQTRFVYSHLLTAHGEPLLHQAREKVTQGIARAFPKTSY
jgi:hypothetical protein